MTNLDSILKSRDITLPTKVRLVKAMVFPVVMDTCACWTIKKAERQRIDTFELWCWRRLLRDPWTVRRFNQSTLKVISPKYSSEGLMLKLQYWPPDAKNWLIGKDPDAGKDWRWRIRGRQRIRCLDGITNSMDMSVSKLKEFEQALTVSDGQGSLACCSPWGHQELDVTELLNWADRYQACC